MHLRFALRLSLLLAVLALPADALGADTVRTFSVTGRVTATTARPSTLSLACPPGAVALNAAVTKQGAGVVVRRSIPGKGSGDWAFRVAAHGSGSRSVSAVLRCVALHLPDGLSHARLDVRTRDRSRMALAPSETRFTRLGCGRGWTATGYALDGGRHGDVRLPEVAPLAREWRFTLENTGTSTAMAAVSVRCIRSTVTATRSGGGTAELRFGVRRFSFERAFQAGPSARSSTGRCPGDRFNLAAGIELDPADPFVMRTASPAGSAGARWTFRNVSAGDGFRAYMVCLARGSSFR